jgi:hypothetical protein
MATVAETSFSHVSSLVSYGQEDWDGEYLAELKCFGGRKIEASVDKAKSQHFFQTT